MKDDDEKRGISRIDELKQNAAYFKNGVKNPKARWFVLFMLVICLIAIAFLVCEWLGVLSEYVSLIVFGGLLVILLIIYAIQKRKGQ